MDNARGFKMKLQGPTCGFRQTSLIPFLRNKKGQAFLEFSFALAMVAFLMIGLVKVFLWTGADLVKRRQAHEAVLTNQDCAGSVCGIRQLRPTFFTSDGLHVAVNSDIF